MHFFTGCILLNIERLGTNANEGRNSVNKALGTKSLHEAGIFAAAILDSARISSNHGWPNLQPSTENSEDGGEKRQVDSFSKTISPSGHETWKVGLHAYTCRGFEKHGSLFQMQFDLAIDINS